jgi:hypothetical protein
LGNSGGSLDDGVEGGETVGNIGEGKSGAVNTSWETASGLGNEVSDNAEHTDASVLDLDVTKTVESFLVTVSDHTERIEESKRSLEVRRFLHVPVGVR